jgi:hypothetical protein
LSDVAAPLGVLKDCVEAAKHLFCHRARHVFDQFVAEGVNAWRSQSCKFLGAKAWKDKLALRLIDRGYRELAKEQNPDTGGRSDNTALLKDVRKRLKQLCRDWALGIAAGL